MDIEFGIGDRIAEVAGNLVFIPVEVDMDCMVGVEVETSIDVAEVAVEVVSIIPIEVDIDCVVGVAVGTSIDVSAIEVGHLHFLAGTEYSPHVF
jgi:hypothetical protein